MDVAISEAKTKKQNKVDRDEIKHGRISMSERYVTE